MDNYTIKIAKGLANNADARLIRQQVFVEEQGFVNEFDDIDHEAYHAVIYTGGYPIATGRLFDEMVKRTLDVSALERHIVAEILAE